MIVPEGQGPVVAQIDGIAVILYSSVGPFVPRKQAAVLRAGDHARRADQVQAVVILQVDGPAVRHAAFKHVLDPVDDQRAVFTPDAAQDHVLRVSAVRVQIQGVHVVQRQRPVRRIDLKDGAQQDFIAGNAVFEGVRDGASVRVHGVERLVGKIRFQPAVLRKCHFPPADEAVDAGRSGVLKDQELGVPHIVKDRGVHGKIVAGALGHILILFFGVGPVNGAAALGKLVVLPYIGLVFFAERDGPVHADIHAAGGGVVVRMENGHARFVGQGAFVVDDHAVQRFQHRGALGGEPGGVALHKAPQVHQVIVVLRLVRRIGKNPLRAEGGFRGLPVCGGIQLRADRGEKGIHPLREGAHPPEIEDGDGIVVQAVDLFRLREEGISDPAADFPGGHVLDALPDRIGIGEGEAGLLRGYHPVGIRRADRGHLRRRGQTGPEIDKIQLHAFPERAFLQRGPQFIKHNPVRPDRIELIPDITAGFIHAQAENRSAAVIAHDQRVALRRVVLHAIVQEKGERFRLSHVHLLR